MCEIYNVARKRKDMFMVGKYPILDSLFESLSSDDYGGGLAISSIGYWVQLSRCMFLKCTANGATISSGRNYEDLGQSICSGGGAYFDVGILEVSYCSFDQCKGTFLGCGIYTSAASNNTMHYVMCKSSESLTEDVNDISIENGGGRDVHKCISSGKYINVSDSRALSITGPINFGCHSKELELKFVNVQMSIPKAHVGFVVSTFTTVEVELNDITLLNGNFDSNYGCFYVWNSNVILTNFYASNCSGILYKNHDNSKMTVKNSYISTLDSRGCTSDNVQKTDGKIIEYFTKFHFVADFATCQIHEGTPFIIVMLAVIFTARGR